jgi:hypothetical protein
MWEDFMRGNWPAAASVMPDPEQLPSAKFVAARSAQTVTTRSAPAVTASYAQAFSPAETTPRPLGGRLAVKAALAAGAGLVIAVLVPGYAVGSTHAVGTHAHVAAHAATSP